MRRILVIDTEAALAAGLEEHFASLRRPARVRRAGDRTRALSELARDRFDAVVCAIDTVGVDGWEVLGRIHADSPTTIRIAVARNMRAAMPTVSAAHRFLPRPASASDVLDVVDRCCNLQGLLVSPAAARLVGSVGTLPSIPHLYAQLLQMLGDPKVGLRDLAVVVEKDTAIAARILQVANSAFFGLPRHVGTIEQALNYTGVHTVKSLVLAAEVFRCFADERRPAHLLLDEIQDHALFAANIARRLPADRKTAEEAFTATLLHDVGQLVLAARLPDEFRENLDVAEEQRRSVRDVEEDRYGVTHAEIGAYLLALWGLPDTIVEAVAHHHTPMRVSHDSFELLDAVHLADHLAREQSTENRHRSGVDATLDQDYVDALELGERIVAWRSIAAEQAGAHIAAR